MKKFIARKSKRTIKEYEKHKLCFQANLGMDRKDTNIYFVTDVIPINAQSVYFGCSWGPSLFNGFAALLKNNPETESLFGPYWPKAVQYLKNRHLENPQLPHLAFWDAFPEVGLKETAWRLGYYVEDVDFKDIVVLSEFSFSHIIKVLQMNTELLLELMDDHTMHRFATDHNLYELQVASPFLKMFGSPKIFTTFGITAKDIGEPKGGTFSPFPKGIG